MKGFSLFSVFSQSWLENTLILPNLYKKMELR